MLVPAIAVLTACTNDSHADPAGIVKNVEHDEVNVENDAATTQESVEPQESEIYEIGRASCRERVSFAV